jgi:hypothetical protein
MALKTYAKAVIFTIMLLSNLGRSAVHRLKSPQVGLILPTVLHLVRPVGARQLSLIDRFMAPTFPSILDTRTPFAMLPRLIEEEFASALTALNRAVTGLVRVEMAKDKSILVMVDDLGLCDSVSVEFDVDTSLLTVKGTSSDADGNKQMMQRAVTVPTKVIKPELLSAESRDGRVVVTIPLAAQAPVPEKAIKDGKLDVKILGQGAAATGEKEKIAEQTTEKATAA